MEYRAVLIAFLLIAASFAALPRQVNPSNVSPDTCQPQLVVALQLAALKSIAAGDFENASATISKLKYAYIPPNLKYLIDRASELISGISVKLNATLELIQMSEQALESGELSRASTLAHRAEIKLGEADIALTRLENALATLSQRLGIPPQLVDKHLSSVRERIEACRARLTQLKAKLYALASKKATVLLVSASRTEVAPGTFINVTVSLKTPEELPLASQRVELVLSGRTVRTLTTDSEGKAYTRVRVPYFYGENVTLYAVYNPPPSSPYRPTISNKIEIRLILRKPTLLINTTKTAKPGSTFTVNGTIALNGTWPGRIPVHIVWMNRVYSVVPGREGRFAINLTVPVDTASGTYTLLAFSEPMGDIAPAVAKAEITVMRLKPAVELALPSILVAYEVNISGLVHCGGKPLGGAYIVGSGLGNGVCVRARENGEFSLPVKIPYLEPSGVKTLVVSVVPTSPCVEPVTVKKEVVYINPLTLAPLLTLILAVVVHHRRFTAVECEPPTAQVQAVPRAPRHRDDVVGLWWLMATFISRKVNAPIRPSHTIREYFNEVSGKIGRLRPVFWYVSTLAELQLYARFKPPKQIYNRLKQRVLRLLGRRGAGRALYALLGVLATTAALVAASLLAPPMQDFDPQNPWWNGLSTLAGKYNLTVAQSLDDLKAYAPGQTVLLIVAPDKPLSQAEAAVLSEFIRHGGTLVVMDDFGEGNDVLEKLGLPPLFLHSLVADPLFKHVNSRLPIANIVVKTRLTANVSAVALNYATALKPAGQPLVYTSEFSYLDLNLNNAYDPGEPKGPFPVAEALRYGLGQVVVIGDPSIAINSMIGYDGNSPFLSNLLDKPHRILYTGLWRIHGLEAIRRQAVWLYNCFKPYEYRLLLAILVAVACTYAVKSPKMREK